jgi:hypothetical protein
MNPDVHTFFTQVAYSSITRWSVSIKLFFTLVLITGSITISSAQLLQGFKKTGKFNEQELNMADSLKKITVNINAPLKFKHRRKTYLVLYALPNGNGIAWTKGKKPTPGDDWHFDIQQIDAQTRFVRKLDKKNNYIIVYLMASQKNWPAWKRTTANASYNIKSFIDSICDMFKVYHPKIVLTGHSGGGSFIFGLLDAVADIPANIESIAFLDSDYGYEDSLHKNKLARWLHLSSRHKLLVLAYKDSLVVFNGKPLVSATGGTWYRSRLMQRNLAESFYFNTVSDSALITHIALEGRIQIILKENPNGIILHTEQVARNGFILSLLFATKFQKKKYFTYFGNRVYERFLTD